MKTKLFILILAALLIGGCGSGSATSDQSVSDTPIETNIDEVLNENSTGEDSGEPFDGTYTPAIQKTVVGWYMRTVAKATLSDGTEYIHKSAGVFGELEASSDEADRHDIASFMDGILQVVFTPEWDENGGTYFSDYRSYSEAQKQVWTFQVKNPRDVDLSNAQLSLSIEGMYDLYSVNTRYEEQFSSDNSKKTALTLIDVDNQSEYSFSDLETANLSMDGLHTRTFRWVLGTVDASDYAPISKPVPVVAKTGLSSVTAKTNAESSTEGTFGLPPSY